MKKLLHFIMAFLLLAAFGVGCSRGGGEAELVAIDSLIAVSPDSALAALGRIDTAALPESGRAYHALLTVQAHYAAYDPAIDSADICRAWRWYAHHGPADRQLRAMRYRARTAEEMGDSVTAMRWYKRTELTAREKGDDFSIGYALMSMAIFYQENYGVQQAIDKFRQADSLLSGIDPECALFCQKQLSQLYQNERWENDSVMRYLLHVDLAAEASHDTTMLADILTNRALYYFYKSNYQTAKEVATDAISRVGQHASAQCWHIASQSFAYLHMLDSATYYRLRYRGLHPAHDGTTRQLSNLRPIKAARRETQSRQ